MDVQRQCTGGVSFPPKHGSISSSLCVLNSFKYVCLLYLHEYKGAVPFPLWLENKICGKTCVAEGRAPWVCSLDLARRHDSHCGVLCLLSWSRVQSPMGFTDVTVQRDLESEQWYARVPVLLTPSSSSELLQIKYPLSEIIGTKGF